MVDLIGLFPNPIEILVYIFLPGYLIRWLLLKQTNESISDLKEILKSLGTGIMVYGLLFSLILISTIGQPSCYTRNNVVKCGVDFFFEELKAIAGIALYCLILLEVLAIWILSVISKPSELSNTWKIVLFVISLIYLGVYFVYSLELLLNPLFLDLLPHYPLYLQSSAENLLVSNDGSDLIVLDRANEIGDKCNATITLPTLPYILEPKQGIVLVLNKQCTNYTYNLGIRKGISSGFLQISYPN